MQPQEQITNQQTVPAIAQQPSPPIALSTSQPIPQPDPTSALIMAIAFLIAVLMNGLTKFARVLMLTRLQR